MLGSNVSVKIKADSEEYIPRYETKDATCADLICNELFVRLLPNQVVVIDCGFSIVLPTGWEALIRPVIGLAVKGIQVTNSPYKDRIKVVLSNAGKEIVDIRKGEKFAQITLKPVWKFDWQVVEELDQIEQGTN
jgi:dUTP pyrophosphatase